MSTTSIAMHAAMARASALTGDGPATLSPSSVSVSASLVDSKRRSPFHVKVASNEGFPMATEYDRPGKAWPELATEPLAADATRVRGGQACFGVGRWLFAIETRSQPSGPAMSK